MKIAFVLGHELPFPPKGGGGVNSLINSLSKAIARLGHQVTAYSPTFDGGATDEIINGVRHIRLEGAKRNACNIKNAIQGLPYARRVHKVIEPCDVLSCHVLTTFLFKPHHHAKVVTHTIHREPKRQLVLMSLVDRIYTGSEAVSEQAASLIPWLAPRIRTIHNCIDFEDYVDLPRTRERVFKFVYVGRFTRDKGIETLVRAFIEIARECPEIVLETIGPQTAEMGAEPGFLAEMKALVTRADVHDRVNFREPIFERPSLEAQVRKADVVCLPSLGGETLNMSVLECARLSKPLLISDLPANLPLLSDGYNGILARSGDVGDWAKGMRRLVNMNATELTNLAHQSYAYAKKHFASDSIAEQYISDFEYLLERAHR